MAGNGKPGVVLEQVLSTESNQTRHLLFVCFLFGPDKKHDDSQVSGHGRLLNLVSKRLSTKPMAGLSEE